MSARCKKCNKVTQRPKTVVTKTRQHEHVEMRPGEYGALEPVIVGVGPQIVSQEQRCESCV